MKERPIIFNAEMVRAVLEGRKTQTRRMLTPRQLKLIDTAASIGECYPLESGYQHANSQSYYRELCPFGAVGDRLWVRETWAEAGGNAPDLQLYRANYPAHVPSHYENVPPVESIRWRPSIHMPRWASRITLEITGVRVERLQDISEADCAAEGLGSPFLRDYKKPKFAALWQSIFGEESWQANPWVWVIEFKRVEGQ